jgi:hypothetical protein
VTKNPPVNLDYFMPLSIPAEQHERVQQQVEIDDDNSENDADGLENRDGIFVIAWSITWQKSSILI